MEVAVLKKFLKIIFPLCVLLFLSTSLASVILLSFVNQEEVTPITESTTSTTRGLSPTLINATVVLNTTLPNVPSYAYTLKRVPRTWSKGQALEIAERIFNVSGEIESFSDIVDGDAWRISDGLQEVRVYVKGAVGYDRYPWDTSYSREQLPSDEKCIAIAEQFIEKFRAEGLMPNSLDLSFHNVEPSATTIFSWPNGTMEGSVDDVSVWFEYSYEGFPLWGYQLRVSIGMDGEIIGFGGYFQDVQLLETVSIGSPEWAIGRLKEGYGERVILIEGPLSELIVNSIKLICFPIHDPSSDSLDLTSYLWVPVYRIAGVAVAEDGRTGEFAWGVPATL